MIDRRRPRALVAAGLMAAACVLAGCSGSSDARGSAPAPAASATTTAPSAPSAPSETTTGAPALSARRFRLAGDPGPPALSGSTLVYPVSSTGSSGAEARQWDGVGALDLTTGRARVVAHTSFRGGFVNWAAAADGWVVVTDQSAVQSDAAPSVLWRVTAIETSTGRRVVLASNGERPDPYVPVLRSGGGYVFWASAEADRTAHESLWRPGWTAPRTLLDHVELTPGSESAADGHLVYLGAAATGASGRTVGGDCWSIPLAGGRPTALTHTALALGCGADATTVAWSEHIDPATTTPPADGILDDPYRVRAAPIAGGRPVTLATGYVSAVAPLVVEGTVFWAGGDGAVVAAQADGRSTSDALRAALARIGPSHRIVADERSLVVMAGDDTSTGAVVWVVPVASG